MPSWWNGIHGGLRNRCPRGLGVRISPKVPVTFVPRSNKYSHNKMRIYYEAGKGTKKEVPLYLPDNM